MVDSDVFLIFYLFFSSVEFLDFRMRLVFSNIKLYSVPISNFFWRGLAIRFFTWYDDFYLRLANSWSSKPPAAVFSFSKLSKSEIYDTSLHSLVISALIAEKT